MPPTTRFSKNMQKKKDMDPSHSSSTARAQPYPIVSMTPPDPPPWTPKERGSSIDIDAFMNQPGHATIVNAIIDQNKETIMENFLRDNVGAFEFGCPPPTNIIDHAHPLFGWQHHMQDHMSLMILSLYSTVGTNHHRQNQQNWIYPQPRWFLPFHKTPILSSLNP